MQLTQYTDYSLRILIHLASKPDGFATIPEISDFYGISKNHLMKVVQNLASHQFIATTRGKNGGMRLARDAAQIRIGDVVRQTEPGFAMAQCFAEEDGCVIAKACGLKGVLNEALGNFWATLDRYTLSDVAANGAGSVREIVLWRAGAPVGSPND